MERRQYTNEFKMEAVRMAQREDIAVAKVARDLGINDGLLHKWIKKFGKRADGSQMTPDEHDELIRLRRENRILKEEQDILKRRRRTSRKTSCEVRVCRFSQG